MAFTQMPPPPRPAQVRRLYHKLCSPSDALRREIDTSFLEAVSCQPSAVSGARIRDAVSLLAELIAVQHKRWAVSGALMADDFHYS